VEYVGELVRLRVADRREREYQSGRKLHSKSTCYFFRIDEDNIIDATLKGGIARFVNHSCSVGPFLFVNHYMQDILLSIFPVFVDIICIIQANCVAKIISVMNEKKVCS
jgi:SET domain-containing protein